MTAGSEPHERPGAGEGFDRRLTPANGRVALEALRHSVTAERYVPGEWASVTAPLTDLLGAPNGRRDRQLLLGEAVLVLERRDGFAFCLAEKDGYCGYVAEADLGPELAPTHWVSAPATHLYPAPDLKQPAVARLSFGARLAIAGDAGRFLATADGRFVPAACVRPIGAWMDDPAEAAEGLIGTPYLWGGNSRDGIDCSGLVQAALIACGLPCPGDSDLQREALGRDLPPDAACRRGDLLFWKGHVAMAVGPSRMIHANAHRMSVTFEDIATAIARIEAAGEGPLLAIKRL